MNSLRLDNFNFNNFKIVPNAKKLSWYGDKTAWKISCCKNYGKWYAVSAIPSMQKLLNKEHEKQKEALKSLLSPTNYSMSVLSLR